MTIEISAHNTFIYKASTGDWHLVVAHEHFEIQPQIGHLTYASGNNLDTLAALITQAKSSCNSTRY